MDGAFRAFGEIVKIDGFVGRSALLFGREITMTSGAVIERDLSLFGADVWLEGAVKGNLKAHADRIELSGVIAGDVEIKAEQITIVKPAVILGKLTYTSTNEAQIDLADGVTIAGGTTWLLPEDKKAEEEDEDRYTSLVLRVSSLFAAFLFGIIVFRLFRPYAEESFTQLRTRFSVAFAAGLLGVALLVLCLIVLVFALATMIAGMVVINTEAAPFGALILIFSLLMLPDHQFPVDHRSDHFLLRQDRGRFLDRLSDCWAHQADIQPDEQVRALCRTAGGLRALHDPLSWIHSLRSDLYRRRRRDHPRHQTLPQRDDCRRDSAESCG